MQISKIILSCLESVPFLCSQLLELMANAGVSVTDLVEEMDDADKTMTTEQLHMIASQLQQV